MVIEIILETLICPVDCCPCCYILYCALGLKENAIKKDIFNPIRYYHILLFKLYNSVNLILFHLLNVYAA